MKKLTQRQKLDIRLLYATGATQAQLARQFGVSQGYICTIVKGHDRGCVDCHTPIPSAKKRCELCRQRRQQHYYQHWYEETGRRGHQRRNGRRVAV